MKTYVCTWCGKKEESNGTPRGWKQITRLFGVDKLFCSAKCEAEWKEHEGK